MAKFDIGDFAKSVSQKVSESNTSTVITSIDLDELVEHEGNFYGIRDLDALISSIELDGLQQPIVVTPAEGGKYRIISGHRRRAAIAQLVADGKEKFRKIPCIVRTYLSKEMENLQLIIANSTTRVLSNAEIAEQAKRVEMLLYQLKEQGVEFPGRMRDQVAAACNVSTTKLAKLKVITEKLTGGWVKLFEANKLPEQTAYAIARMTPELQERLYRVTNATIDGSRADRILEKAQAEKWTWTPDMSCPDGKPCTHGDAFLRRDAKCSAWDMCGGQRCCLTCPQAQRDWSPCENMCSKAKALRKDKKAEDDAKEQTRKKKLSDGYKAKTQENAQRLAPLLDAAEIADEAIIKCSLYGANPTAGEIRKFAEGEFPDGLWSQAQLEPRFFSNLVEVSKQLRCSTDYILGLTDEPAQYPVEKSVDDGENTWISTKENMPEIGQEVLIYWDWQYKDIAEYKSGILGPKWISQHYGQVDLTSVTHWMPLPELPEED